MGAFITISVLTRIKNLKGIFLTGTFLPSKGQLFLMKILLHLEKNYLHHMCKEYQLDMWM